MQNNDEVFILKGKLSSLIIVNCSAAVFGGLILYTVSRVPHYGKTFFAVSLPILIIWLVADTWLWYSRGVNEMHISKDGIKVFRGPHKKITFFTPDEITDMHVHTRLNRKSLNILLEKKVAGVPGIFTYYPGKKVHLFSDAFNDNDFDKAIELLADLAGNNNND